MINRILSIIGYSLGVLLVCGLIYLIVQSFICPDDNSIYHIEIEEIDSCEYVVIHQPYGNSICHKGNCKYCNSK